jgi:hypothetical protein
MKIIISMFLGVMIILMASRQPARSQESDDPYDLTSVRTLISFGHGEPIVQVGSFEKHNNAMGDRAAIGIIKIYTQDDLLKPANVNAYLPVIRAAFQFPNLISRKDDRDPKATILLLRYLGSNVKDAALRKQVLDLETEISKLSQSPSRPPN